MQNLDQRWRITISPYLSRELSYLDQIWYADASFHSEDGYLTKNGNFANSRWRSGAILKIALLPMPLHHIGRLIRHLEQRWRIICRYRSRDQNGNFRKFKMADGRHFENSFFSISQPRIIQFWLNFVCRCEFPFRGWSFDRKIKILQIQDGGWTPDWKCSSVFRRHFGRLVQNLDRRCRIACKHRSCDQNSNFQQFNSSRHVENSVLAFRHIHDSCNELKLSNV